jgi:hypothetical protein
MYNIKLAGVLRFISIIVISLLVFLYITINIVIDDIAFKSSDAQPRKEYEYRASPGGMSIPEFTYNLESLFPGQLIPVIAETIIVSEPAATVDIPSLKFIGMIETDKKIIYSFRNMDTNRMLLLEEGSSVNGLTLQAIERSPAGRGKVFILKKQGHTFQVGKE